MFIFNQRNIYELKRIIFKKKIILKIKKKNLSLTLINFFELRKKFCCKKKISKFIKL